MGAEDELPKDRLQEAGQRQGLTPENLWVINREDFPNLPPLNTEDGQKFVEWMTEQIGGVDLITFDNIQALVVGSLKEDETWAPMLPWISQPHGEANWPALAAPYRPCH